MSADLEYPQLRYVEAFPVETNNGPLYGLRDPNGIATETLVLSPDVFYLLQYFDGKHSLVDLRSKYHQTFGNVLSEEQLGQMLSNLDKHLFLQNKKFEAKLRTVEQAFQNAKSRPAIHAGKSYEADPIELRKQIDGFFEHAEGAGHPNSKRNAKVVKGLIAPHIDVRAGGPCYSHAYRALAESSGADCFVILGTGHSGLSNLYSILAKDFETPFGLARCDFDFIDLLKSKYNGDVESEILAHKNEHVIEFQLAFLKYLYESKREFTFVPLLCSFSYHMLSYPQFVRERQIVEEFTAALKETIASFGKKVCLLASVDFAHVGQRYGDQGTMDFAFLDDVRKSDHALLNCVQQLDAEALYRCLEANQDRYRICGFSSIYTLLKAIEAKECRLLNYSSTDVDQNQSTVTFASLVLH